MDENTEYIAAHKGIELSMRVEGLSVVVSAKCPCGERFEGAAFPLDLKLRGFDAPLMNPEAMQKLLHK